MYCFPGVVDTVRYPFVVAGTAPIFLLDIQVSTWSMITPAFDVGVNANTFPTYLHNVFNLLGSTFVVGGVGADGFTHQNRVFSVNRQAMVKQWFAAEANSTFTRRFGASVVVGTSSSTCPTGVCGSGCPSGAISSGASADCFAVIYGGFRCALMLIPARLFLSLIQMRACCISPHTFPTNPYIISLPGRGFKFPSIAALTDTAASRCS